MGWLVVMVRRALWLLLIGAAGGAAYAWWRDRSTPTAPEPAEWPPLVAQRDAPLTSPDEGDDALGDASIVPDAAPITDSPASTTDPPASTTDPPASTTDPPASTADPSQSSARPATSSSSVVNSLVDAPEARSAGGGGGSWVEPDNDGACPLSHPIKANDNSGIFHVPEGRFYARTRAERCYQSAEAATADGYRQAKS